MEPKIDELVLESSKPDGTSTTIITSSLRFT